MDAKITLILRHGGRFTPRANDGKVEYIGREFDVWEDISANYMNTFILCDLLQACKKYSRIGDCFWLIDKDLDFNHGLRSCTTNGDILYLMKDALENENEINVYFHHKVYPIPEEVPLMLDLKCHPIPKASNEDDLDDVPVAGHKEGKFLINLYCAKNEHRDYFQIKSFKHEHKCLREIKNKQANREWVVSKLEAKLRIQPSLKCVEVLDYFKQEFGVHIEVTKMWRAMKEAKQLVERSDDKNDQGL
ncbi:hypothetical protein GmHk_15G044818 [Glycine max]|nr:hypothetical protein GmHk_15G044818 [Glycine max]